MRGMAWKLKEVTLAAGLVLAAGPVLAQGQQKELSDRSVQTIMNYAWTILPAKFTAPTGRTIEIDKSKNDALVPLATGRDVVKAGYLSAQAQLCEMWEEQVANYDALMARERSKNSWSDQQLLYITTLHRMTIHMAAGKVKIVEKGAEEVQIVLEAIEPKKENCTDDRRKQLKERIAAYVKDAPVLAQAPRQQGGTAGSTSAIQPAAAKDQKK